MFSELFNQITGGILARNLKFAALILTAFLCLTGCSYPIGKNASESAVENLVDQFYSLAGKSYDKQRRIAQEILDIGTSQNDPEVEVRGLARLAYVEFLYGCWDNNWRKKLKRCKLLCQSSRIQSTAIARAEYLMFRGHIRGKWQGDPGTGLNEINEAIWIANQARNDVLLSWAYNLGAEMLVFQRQSLRAREYAFRCLEIAETLGDRVSLANALLRVTHVLMIVNGDYEEVAGYARRLNKINPDNSLAKHVLAQIGEQPDYEKNLVKQIDNLARAAPTNRNSERLAGKQIDLAQFLKNQDRFAEALSYAEKALVNFRRAGNSTEIQVSGFEVAELKILTGDPNVDVEKLIETVTESSSRVSTVYSARRIATICSLAGKHELARQWYEKANDEFSTERTAEISQTRVAAREFWLSELRARKQQQEFSDRNALFVQRRFWTFFTFALLAVGLISWRFLASKKTLRVLQEEIRLREQTQLKNRLLHDQLIHSQKLEAVGTLAAGVAHDFNNSLATIVNFAQVAAKNTPRNSDQSDYLNHILDAARLASGTTRELLTFSGQETASFVSQNIVPVIAQSHRFLDRLLPASINLELNLPERSTIYCRIDTSRIQLVLVNLVINARDALHDGGEITIQLSVDDDRPDLVTLSVSDNGTGMTREVAQRVFDPFFTTKGRGKGTGLGMSIVHGIVEEHGGTVRLDSTPGHGTRVIIDLPVAEQPDPREFASTPVVDGTGRTVLLVEDNNRLRLALKMQLEAIGFLVLDCEDGHQAIQRFREHSGTIELIIMDVDLPEFDGESCLAAIREQAPWIPAILMSGLPSQMESDRACFIRKPFGEKELHAAIARLLITERKVLVVCASHRIRDEVVADPDNVEILQAANASEALDLYARHGDHVESVLLDGELPEIELRTLLDGLRRITPSLRPVIIADETADLALDPGEQIIAQPFCKAVVVHVIKEMTRG